MPGHLPALDHAVMDSTSVLYAIRISGHLGDTMLSAFPALRPPERPTRSVGELESASHRVGAMAK